MSADPFDMVRQSIQALNTHNALLAEQAKTKALGAAGDRMAIIMADLEDIETNAVTKAILRDTIRKWEQVRGDA